MTKLSDSGTETARKVCTHSTNMEGTLARRTIADYAYFVHLIFYLHTVYVCDGTVNCIQLRNQKAKRKPGRILKAFLGVSVSLSARLNIFGFLRTQRPIFTQDNKHGIGPDRNTIEPAHGLSVPIFCSSLNL